jgi:hypothetical protein
VPPNVFKMRIPTPAVNGLIFRMQGGAWAKRPRFGAFAQVSFVQVSLVQVSLVQVSFLNALRRP